MKTVPEPHLRLYTIGHSSRSFEEFLDLLLGSEIRTLVDIRRFPGSRKFPHFDRVSLETSLPGRGIRYVWMQALGGFRHGAKGVDSPNIGLESPGFRAYADYMASDEFRTAVQRLVEMASESPTAYMCAEAVHWRCHRMILSDYLLAQGVDVLHILGPGEPVSHRITDGAVVAPDGRVTYPPRRDHQGDLGLH